MKMIKTSTVGAWSTRTCGAWGGAIDGGISAVRNVRAVMNGEKTGVEAAACIAKDTTGGVLSGVASAAAATAAGPATAIGVAGMGLAGTALGAACVAAAPLMAAVAVGCVVGHVWRSVMD